MYYHFYHSPVGKIRITASDNGITSLMLPVQQKSSRFARKRSILMSHLP